jgi:hypothetical protein
MQLEKQLMARRISWVADWAQRSIAVSVAWLLLAAPALAADPLTVIPDDALGLAVINNLADTSARVQKVAEKMQLPVPELLPMAQLYTGVQQGLDDKGTLAVAMFPGGDENATWASMVAVFVPVSDYKAFVAQLQPDDASAEIAEVTIMGQALAVTQKGEFAVLATPDAKPLLEKIKGNSKSVSNVLGPLRPWLAKQQIAVALTPTGKKLLLATVGGLMDAALEGAEQAGNDDAQAAQAIQSTRESMQALKDLLSAADEQLTQLGVGLRIDDATAMYLSGRLLISPEGGLAAWAKDVKPPKAGLLAGLPPDKYAIAYGGAAVEFHPAVAKLTERMTQLSMTMLGLSEEDRKQLSEVMTRYSSNRTSTAGMFGQLRPGDSIVATSMQVEHVKDAAAHLKLAREMFEIFAKAKLPGADPAKPLYALADVEVGDLKTLEVTMDMGAMVSAGAANNQQAVAEMMQGVLGKLLGNEGIIRSYLTVADDHTLVMAYSKEQLQHAVAHVRSGAAGLEANEPIGNTRKLLPEGAQWGAYISPQGVVQWVDMLLKQFEVQVNLPAFPDSDPIGLAARISPEALDAELVLPESVIAGIGQYIGLIQQMMMQGGAPLP